MWTRELLELVAKHCDACSREALSQVSGLKFRPHRLTCDRLKNLNIPRVTFCPESQTHNTYYTRNDHLLHVKISRYNQWTAYEYMYEKYDRDGKLVYCTNYFTDSDCNIVVQHPTFCRSDQECGCILCMKHLQTNPGHLIAEIPDIFHEWHILKSTRCPHRFFSFKDNPIQRLDCRAF